MSFATKYQDKLYYGQYGGCFISDAFSISCDTLYEDYLAIGTAPAFLEECLALVKKLAPPSIAVETHALNGHRILVHPLAFNPCAIAGHALLAQKTGRPLALFAPRHTDEAMFCAQVCGLLGLRLKLHLPLSLRGIKSLTGWLRGMDVELETTLCGTFDLPEMYAFQEWIAAPEKTHCIYSRSNVGAFPAPLITTAFNSLYGKALAQKAGDATALVAPCVSGTTALTLLKPWFGSGKKLYTAEVEDTGMYEELDSFCGAFTKVMRDSTRDRPLAPELANAWDTGAVSRHFVPDGSVREVMRQANAQLGWALAPEGAAAVHLALALEGEVLVACGAPRMGAAL